MLKSIINKCLVCQRKWARPVRQGMGDLPAVRCSPGSTFNHVGIDYAGPLYITQGRGRGHIHRKTYVALFVCMTSRAIHLELSVDVSTKCFMAVLERFCGRRGTPAHIFSDNGSNFKGACNELKLTLQELQTTQAHKEIHRWCYAKGVIWHFQPAYSPHYGGLWEAGVKTLKNLIRDSLYYLSLTADELHTILISAEAVMNSRPYLPIHSTDPDAVCPLTPGHFLIGRPLCSLPRQVDVGAKLQNLRHWDLVVRIQHEHWEQFKKMYLPQLAARAQELQKKPNLEINDVVLIMDQETRRNHWPLGLVVAVHPGKDGLVRTVDVRVETGGTASKQMKFTRYRRSVQHLVKMPVAVTDTRT